MTELQAGGCSPGIAGPVSKLAQRGCSGAAWKPWTDSPVSRWLGDVCAFVLQIWRKPVICLSGLPDICSNLSDISREGKDWHEDTLTIAVMLRHGLQKLFKQVVLGSGFVKYAVQTGSCLYGPYPEVSGMFPAPPHPWARWITIFN